MKYLAVIEKSETGFGAYVPDLPGCIAVAETEAEVKELIEEAVAFHIEGLREAGEQIPAPSSNSIFIDVKAA
jgi:predicted RNase H-like HicB family nuclease